MTSDEMITKGELIKGFNVSQYIKTCAIVMLYVLKDINAPIYIYEVLDDNSISFEADVINNEIKEVVVNIGNTLTALVTFTNNDSNYFEGLTLRDVSLLFSGDLMELSSKIKDNSLI
jgi:hypothetical protein